ncbi:MAG TPA: WYL domain-containing protein [Tepidisphaeraceae bacterium]|nr:WYL domain-containing protein [Tepidisphaeraceae bacterium]
MGRKYDTRLNRLLRLLSAIQGRRGLNVRDLARLCEVHVRSIHRDIRTLNESGFPCAFDPETQGYKIAKGFFMPPIEFTLDEAMAVVELLEQAGDGRQIPFYGAASRAAEKLRSQLPAVILGAVQPSDGCIHVDLARSQADDSSRDVYDQVRAAIAQRRMLRCKYEPAKTHLAGKNGDDEAFDLHPYALWYCQRAWYVVGHHSGRGAIRRLKLNRFTLIRATDRPFAIPDDFNLHADLGNAWRMIRGDKSYQIAIRFDREFADTASETRWHPTQQEEWDHAAGSVTLRFTVDGLDEIVWWVLGYGPGATVLEPPELIQRVKQLAREKVKRYTKKKRRPR